MCVPGTWTIGWVLTDCLTCLANPLACLRFGLLPYLFQTFVPSSFLVLLRLAFHISAFHHSHTPGIVKLETSAVLFLFIKDMAEREIPGTLLPGKSSLNYIPIFTSSMTLNNSNDSNKLLSVLDICQHVTSNICQLDTSALQGRCIITIRKWRC